MGIFPNFRGENKTIRNQLIYDIFQGGHDGNKGPYYGMIYFQG